MTRRTIAVTISVLNVKHNREKSLLENDNFKHFFKYQRVCVFLKGSRILRAKWILNKAHKITYIVRSGDEILRIAIWRRTYITITVRQQHIGGASHTVRSSHVAENVLLFYR